MNVVYCRVTLGNKRAITATVVKDRIREDARMMREEIGLSLKNRMFSLKLDCASRLDHSLLGINVRYDEKGKMLVQPLTTRELFGRHKAQHLSSEVINALSRFKLNVSQVYSVTRDNGANMVKTVRLLGEMNEECSDSEEEVGSSDPEVESHALQSLLENPESALSDDSGLIEGMRCAAHTPQLAVNDELKGSGCGHMVEESRALVIRLSVQCVIPLIRKLGLKKPVLDFPTRGMSALHMLTRLLELRGFAGGFLSQEESSKWTEDEGAEV